MTLMHLILALGGAACGLLSIPAARKRRYSDEYTLCVIAAVCSGLALLISALGDYSGWRVALDAFCLFAWTFSAWACRYKAKLFSR